MSDNDSPLDALSGWIARVDTELGQLRPTATPAWQRPDWYESSVQLALNHLTEPGDFAFDVGANIGVISARLGQLVGPFGRVVGFEASPRVLPLLHTNLNNSNAFNVMIENAAVTERSGATVQIHYGSDHVADSIMAGEAGGAGHPVRTISLDDYARRVGRMPDVIKMDIEGAEHLAMMGAAEILREARPPVVVEFSSSNIAFVNWMAEQGYHTVIDIGLMEPFIISEQSHLVNGLFLHADNPRGHEFTSIKKLQIADEGITGGEDLTIDLAPLEAGSYMLLLDYTQEAQAIDELMEVALFCNQDRRLLSIASVSHLAAAYTHLPFWIDMPGPARLELHCTAARTKAVADRYRLFRLMFPQ
ncbi:MAG TPA: FkbM family methyltransferase [Nitrosospira sp.]|nr:FkbM family methyltransferase [Nitrosospira sp.]